MAKEIILGTVYLQNARKKGSSIVKVEGVVMVSESLATMKANRLIKKRALRGRGISKVQMPYYQIVNIEREKRIGFTMN